MNTLGLDEAGRGPVLGPMVVAGIVIGEKEEKIIKRMGVKDSKRISPNKRTILARKLKKMFKYELVEISAKEIDSLRKRGVNLNQIEKLAMQKIIITLKEDNIINRIIIDSLDIKESRLEDEIKQLVSKDTEVIAEHKADDNYLVVGAASIIAKARRDEIISEINKNYIRETKNRDGIGSGYPSDPKTKKFLKNYKYDEMPEFVRRTWGTIQRIKEAEESKK